MNQITTQYITENGACYEQYVITDPAAKTSLTITPERGGMITGFTLDGDHSGVSVLNLYELCADVLIRNFDILLRSLDALVAFNGNHRLHNNGELQLDAVLAGNGGNVRIGNRDDFQTGSFEIKHFTIGS